MTGCRPLPLPSCLPDRALFLLQADALERSFVTSLVLQSLRSAHCPACTGLFRHQEPEIGFGNRPFSRTVIMKAFGIVEGL